MTAKDPTRAYRFAERWTFERIGIVYARNAEEARDRVRRGEGESIDQGPGGPTGGVRVRRSPEDDRQGA